MYEIKDIKRDIKKGDLVYWFDRQSKLILSGKSKIDTQKLLNKKKLKNGTQLIRLTISFHTGDKLGQGGQIAVSSKLFEVINDKVVRNKWENNLIGYIWFGDNYLERMNWKSYFLDKIINKLNGGIFKFVFGITKYEKNIK